MFFEGIQTLIDAHLWNIDFNEKLNFIYINYKQTIFESFNGVFLYFEKNCYFYLFTE